jgi:hypothetical protein
MRVTAAPPTWKPASSAGLRPTSQPAGSNTVSGPGHHEDDRQETSIQEDGWSTSSDPRMAKRSTRCARRLFNRCLGRSTAPEPESIPIAQPGPSEWGMGADGHHPQPAKAVQGNAGNGLRHPSERQASWDVIPRSAQRLFRFRGLLLTCDKLIGEAISWQ